MRELLEPIEAAGRSQHL